jgi:tetratricopeptide (TPR) repeat protein
MKPADTIGFPRTPQYVCLLCLFALIAVASFLPDRRLWGINHLAFYSTPVKVVALAIVAISFLPAVSRRVYGSLVDAVSVLRSDSKLRRWLILVVPVISVVLFLVFQSSTLLLGDGQVIANEFEVALGGRESPFELDAATLVRHHPHATGAMLLYYALGSVANRVFNTSPVDGIRILNCMLGGILVLLLLLIVASRALPAVLSVWLAGAVLFSGAMQVFFGYVETYAPVVFFSYGYLLSGLMFIHTRHRVWLAAALLLLVIACSMHLLGALLLPSAGFLLASTGRRFRRGQPLRLLASSLLAAFLAVAYVLGRFTEYGAHFLPLRTTGDTQGILSASHWLDILNELHIILPTVLLFAVIALVGRLAAGPHDCSRKEDDGSRHRRNGRLKSAEAAWLRLEVELVWVVLMLIPCLTFMLVFKADIGMPRDWDLFAITCVGLLPLSMHIANRCLAYEGSSSFSGIAAPAVVISVVMGVAWIGINASSERSVRRYGSILEYDKTFAAYAYEVLAKHHHEHQDLDRAIAAMQQAIFGSDNLRQRSILVSYYLEAGRGDEAIELLHQILGLRRRHEQARAQLVLLLDRAGRYDELLPVARDGSRYHAKEPFFHFYRGKALIGTGRIPEGVEAMLHARQLDPEPGIKKEIDRILEHLRNEGKL